MEYSLLKKISPPLPFIQFNSHYINLSSTPAKDYVNPGIGQLTRLFSFYVPLASVSNPYEILKVDKDVKNVVNQEGFGEENIVNEKNTSDFVPLDENKLKSHTLNSETNIENEDDQNMLSNDMSKNDETFNDSQKEKKIDAGVLESFQYPKIKVGKILIRKDESSFKKTSKPNLKMLKKITKHKFNVI